MAKEQKVAVIAIGGNSLVNKGRESIADQYAAVAETARHIADMIESGWTVAIGHGNGPQVGFVLRRSEVAHRVEGIHEVPLDVCGADTQGATGYMLQQNLYNEFLARGIDKKVATVVTQVEVDRNDPAFQNPSKPIGPFLTREQAEERRDRLGWKIVEDSGRGWRRLVASPRPVRVVQRHMIRDSARAGHIVVACGGGGIPIIRREDNDYVGIEAVIDKDLTSSVLAAEIGAELLIILTDVPQVYVHFGKPEQQALGAVTVEEVESLYAAGHFARGSMGPKVEAILGFLKAGGKRGLITSPARLADALDGRAGTHFVGRI